MVIIREKIRYFADQISSSNQYFEPTRFSLLKSIEHFLRPTARNVTVHYTLYQNFKRQKYKKNLYGFAQRPLFLLKKESSKKK